ncbi:MAG: nuclear transport factor 2 family protein [Solidesulfovibrio sp.]
MSEKKLTDSKIQSVIEYFEKVDSGDSSYLDLFTKEVKFFFPKFGASQGKDALIAFGRRIGSTLSSIKHNIENFHYIVSDNTIVVEGIEEGTTQLGISWPDGNISQGRFCSVFEFSGNLISRMYIYVDPDFTSSDTDRVAIFYRSPEKTS